MKVIKTPKQPVVYEYIISLDEYEAKNLREVVIDAMSHWYEVSPQGKLVRALNNLLSSAMQK